ncbi:unnamed protein product [Paramecium octaurelia]|uniref:Uncharacterized protein n=1 Tax=Paramecium octaurelia TaxID=43137 RepID=A0A8S1V555_PAROT|nr:unnamed protein product [Paramecium octaurelia]
MIIFRFPNIYQSQYIENLIQQSLKISHLLQLTYFQIYMLILGEFQQIIQLKRLTFKFQALIKLKNKSFSKFFKRREYDFSMIICIQYLDQNHYASDNHAITSKLVIIYNWKSSMEFQFNYFLID